MDTTKIVKKSFVYSNIGVFFKVDQTFSKESLQEFVVKKREMFLVQYALGVKRQEMQKLEEIAQVKQ